MGSSDVKSLLVWAVLRPINESVPFVKKAAKSSRFTEKKKNTVLTGFEVYFQNDLRWDSLAFSIPFKSFKFKTSHWLRTLDFPELHITPLDFKSVSISILRNFIRQSKTDISKSCIFAQGQR